MAKYNKDQHKKPLGRTLKEIQEEETHGIMQRGPDGELIPPGSVSVPTVGGSNRPAGANDHDDALEDAQHAQSLQNLLRLVQEKINHLDPRTFCTFGSAEKYYLDAFNLITNTYPYDGSLAEKNNWHALTASSLVNAIYNHAYPRNRGHVSFSPSGWGSATGVFTTSSVVSPRTNYPDTWYGQPSSPEYIYFTGGPQKGTIFSSALSRENNLKLDPSAGNTVEFWLKKDPGSLPTTGSREVIFDIETLDDLRNSPLSESYGRFSVELATPPTEIDWAFRITYESGSYGFRDHAFGRTEYVAAPQPGVSPAAELAKWDHDSVYDGKWHHYAFCVTHKILDERALQLTRETAGFDPELSIGEINPKALFVYGYRDGELSLVSLKVRGAMGLGLEFNPDVTGRPLMGPINYPLAGAIGARLSGSVSAKIPSGLGKLSGSIDEFRFWKTARPVDKINDFYYIPVHGASDSAGQPSRLGIYYKFNEGIATDTAPGVADSINKTIIDYSGRANNGKFVGYSSKSRLTASAMDSSNSEAVAALLTNLDGNTEISYYREPGDVILNPKDRGLTLIRDKYTLHGRVYDEKNHASLQNNIPSFILDLDSEADFNMKSDMQILLQTIASEFDRLKSVIDFIPEMKTPRLNPFSSEFPAPYTGSYDEAVLCLDEIEDKNSNIGNWEENPFAELLLLEGGWFQQTQDMGLFYRQMEDDSGYTLFEAAVPKNVLLDIGSPPFENKLYKVKNKILHNIYSSMNLLYMQKGTLASFRNLIRSFGVDESLIRVNVYSNNEKIDIISRPVLETIKQKSVSLYNSEKVTTLYQTSSDSSTRSYIAGSSQENGYTFEANILLPEIKVYDLPRADISLFGLHSVNTTGNQLTWHSNDYGDIRVTSHKFNFKNSGYFKVSSSYGLFQEMTSSHIPNMYGNNHWNISLRIEKDTKNKISDYNAGFDYVATFSGFNYASNHEQNNFLISESVSRTKYNLFNQSDKSVYLGAHRTNFSGSVLQYTDAKFLGLNVWLDSLEDDELRRHAANPSNIGRIDPMKNISTRSHRETLKADTLIFAWKFDDISSPKTLGKRINITDSSTGSLDVASSYSGQVGYSYPGVSTELNSLDLVNMEFISAPTYKGIDNPVSEDKVQIRKRELDRFDASASPVDELYSFEKSMYQVISDEMYEFISGVQTFHQLIGEPVNRYRHDYKAMQKLRERFFCRVESEIDLERFVECYKWIDSSVGQMLENLKPASAAMDSSLRNVVESHALERNKYKYHFPTLEKKPSEPEAVLLGINELLYDWEHGHAPLSFGLNKSAASASIEIAGGMISAYDGGKFTLVSTDGTSIEYSFDDSQAADYSAPVIKLGGLNWDKAGIGEAIVSAITHSSGHQGKIYASSSADPTGPIISLGQAVSGSSGNTNITTSSLATSGFTIVNFSGGLNAALTDDENCLWQKDRRKHKLSDRKKIQKVLTTNVEGSSYVLRNLTKPYKLEIQKSKKLEIGSNSSANKIKDFYKIIYSDQNIFLNSEDLTEAKVCKDIIHPEKKKKYFGKTDTSGTSGYMDADSDLIYPFSLYSSSVNSDLATFRSKLLVANNHRPYNSSLSTPMSERFAEYPHRMVQIGAKKSDRPEAYNLDTFSGVLTMSAPSLGSLRSFFRTENPGPYQIKNRKYSTSGPSFGNYNKDYEIVLTNGRSLNNNYITENSEVTPATSIYPETDSGIDFGVVDFLHRSGSVRREHVFVNKFSAPAPVPTFAVDRESGEYSPYNSINYRNNNIRSVLNTLSGEYSEKFGYRSGSTSQMSIHCVNKNLQRFTGSRGRPAADNNFVQHPIPQSAYQYSWITASVEDGVQDFLNRNENFGYIHNFQLNNATNEYGNSQSQIGFITNSTSIRGNKTLPFTPDYSSAASSSIDTSKNILNSESIPEIDKFREMLLTRQGPYGWPSWKQSRLGAHPLAISLKKNNYISLTHRPPLDHTLSPGIRDYYGNHHDYSDVGNSTSDRVVTNYKDICITGKFNPIVLTVTANNILNPIRQEAKSFSSYISQRDQDRIWFNDEYFYSFFHTSSQSGVFSESERVDRIGGHTSIRVSYQNELSAFANKLITRRFRIKEVRKHKFNEMLNLASSVISNPGTPLSGLEMNYIETIYPREINTYTKNARYRENFDFFGWKSNRELRRIVLTGSVKYGGYGVSVAKVKAFPKIESINHKNHHQLTPCFVDSIDLNSVLAPTVNIKITSSSWPLDSRENYVLPPVNIGSSYFTEGNSFLSNRTQGTRGEGCLQNDYSIFGLGYNGLHGAPPPSPLYNRRIPQEYGTASYLAGEAYWSAAEDHSVGPFYDSYEDYNQDIKLVGQDHSLVGEYRMSEFVEDFYTTGESNLANFPDDYLSLTGSIYPNSVGHTDVGSKFFETYSTTDFMKYFQPVLEHIETNELGHKAFRFTLKCEAAMKFIPYRGFYPAERTVQIGEIFSRGYLPEIDNPAKIVDDLYTVTSPKSLLEIRKRASLSQTIKPLMSPGVLYNSIKSGLAVDYPIFETNHEKAYGILKEEDDVITSHSSLLLGAEAGFTGSAINNTEDKGIPRLRGKVPYRVKFADLLDPSRIYESILYDNEPHPSASLLYGNQEWNRVMDRPFKFGTLDKNQVRENLGINLTSRLSGFNRSMQAYKSAIANFASETVKFFLEPGGLNTIYSKPLEGDDIFRAGQKYSMRVYLENRDVEMYDRHSAFGPPVDEGDVEMTVYNLSHSVSGTPGVAATASLSFNQASSVVLPATSTLVDLPGFEITDTSATTGKIRFYDQNDFSVAGTMSTGSLQFRDPDDVYTYASGSSESTLPGFSVEDTHGRTVYVRFYDQFTYTPTATSTSKFVDLYPLVGGDATQFAAAVNTQLCTMFNAGATYVSSSVNGSDSTIIDLVQKFSGSNGNTTVVGLNSFFKVGSSTHMAVKDPALTLHGGAHISYNHPSNTSNIKYINLRTGGTLNTNAELANLTSTQVNALTVDVSSSNVSENLQLTQSSTGTSGNTTIAEASSSKTFFNNISTQSESSFGGGTEDTQTSSSVMTQSEQIQSCSHGYMPYVPPFLDRNAAPYVEFILVPKETGPMNLDQILADIKIRHVNFESKPNNVSTNTNYKYSMSLTSSIDFFLQVGDYDNKKLWAMQTKWETPVVDFVTASAKVLNLSNNTPSEVTGSPWKSRSWSDYYSKTTSNVASAPILTSSIGMWHQRGDSLRGNQGYFLKIQDGHSAAGERATESITFNNATTFTGLPLTLGRAASMAITSSKGDSYFIFYSSKKTGDERGESAADAHVNNTRFIDVFDHEAGIYKTAATIALNFSSALDSQTVSEGLDYQVNGGTISLTQSQGGSQRNGSIELYASRWTHLTGGAELDDRIYTTWYSPKAIVSSFKDGTAGFSGGEEFSPTVNTIGLASKLGFIENPAGLGTGIPREIKLNQVAEKKNVSECVVAIPYTIKQGECQFQFFPIDRVSVQDAARKVLEQDNFLRNETIRVREYLESENQHVARAANHLLETKLDHWERPRQNKVEFIAYQLRMMSKYVLPPQLDFLKDVSINPFLMYMFEFNATFSKSDLEDIWQNLYPTSFSSTGNCRYSNKRSPLTIEDSVRYVSHYLDSSWLNDPLDSDGDMSPVLSHREVESFLGKDVRWMVFKIKFRGEWDYTRVKEESIFLRSRHRIRNLSDNAPTTEFTRKEGPLPDIQFNWPYDYFSIVELIKTEGKVDFINSAEEIQTGGGTGQS